MEVKRLRVYTVLVSFLASFLFVVKSTYAATPNSAIGNALYNVFGFLNVIDLKSVLGNGEQLFYLKVILFIILVSILGYLFKMLFKDSPKTAWTVASGFSLLGVIGIPGEIIVDIFRTYSVFASMAFFGFLLFGLYLLQRKMSENFENNSRLGHLINALIIAFVILIFGKLYSVAAQQQVNIFMGNDWVYGLVTGALSIMLLWHIIQVFASGSSSSTGGFGSTVGAGLNNPDGSTERRGLWSRIVGTPEERQQKREARAEKKEAKALTKLQAQQTQVMTKSAGHLAELSLALSKIEDDEKKFLKYIREYQEYLVKLSPSLKNISKGMTSAPKVNDQAAVENYRNTLFEEAKKIFDSFADANDQVKPLIRAFYENLKKRLMTDVDLENTLQGIDVLLGNYVKINQEIGKDILKLKDKTAKEKLYIEYDAINKNEQMLLNFSKTYEKFYADFDAKIKKKMSGIENVAKHLTTVDTLKSGVFTVANFEDIFKKLDSIIVEIQKSLHDSVKEFEELETNVEKFDNEIKGLPQTIERLNKELQKLYDDYNDALARETTP